MAQHQVSENKLAEYATRINELIEREQSTSLPDQLRPLGDVGHARLNTLREVRDILYEKFPYLKK